MSTTPYPHLHLYPEIIVDLFALPPPPHPQTPPSLYLLSHTHHDHIRGLDALSFCGKVICSPDAKEMILRMETAKDRIEYDLGIKEDKVRPWAKLRVKPRKKNGKAVWHGSRDLLTTVPLNTPTDFNITPTESVRITLLDANHCPGSVMFLVEGSRGSVLHTGDVRSEPAMIASLRRNPLVAPYVSPSADFPGTLVPSTPAKVIAAIHLDTACFLGTVATPPKEEAVAGLMSLIRSYPPTTKFFINAWTWGYESILTGLSRVFQTKIHVDRYKNGILTRLSDPLLASCVTVNPQATRFHACERGNRCAEANEMGVVYVNPCEMPALNWDVYLSNTLESIRCGNLPRNLLVPLARHSPLPELRALVQLFRPLLVLPNTLLSPLRGLDWAAMPRAFGDCVAHGGSDMMWDSIVEGGYGHLKILSDARIQGVLSGSESKDDIEMQNWVGVDADDMKKLAFLLGRPHDEDGRSRRRDEQLSMFLGVSKGSRDGRLASRIQYDDASSDDGKNELQDSQEQLILNEERRASLTNQFSSTSRIPADDLQSSSIELDRYGKRRNPNGLMTPEGSPELGVAEPGDILSSPSITRERPRQVYPAGIRKEPVHRRAASKRPLEEPIFRPPNRVTPLSDRVLPRTPAGHRGELSAELDALTKKENSSPVKHPLYSHLPHIDLLAKLKEHQALQARSPPRPIISPNNPGLALRTSPAHRSSPPIALPVKTLKQSLRDDAAQSRSRTARAELRGASASKGQRPVVRMGKRSDTKAHSNRAKQAIDSPTASAHQSNDKIVMPLEPLDDAMDEKLDAEGLDKQKSSEKMPRADLDLEPASKRGRYGMKQSHHPSAALLSSRSHADTKFSHPRPTGDEMMIKVSNHEHTATVDAIEKRQSSNMAPINSVRSLEAAVHNNSDDLSASLTSGLFPCQPGLMSGSRSQPAKSLAGRHTSGADLSRATSSSSRSSRRAHHNALHSRLDQLSRLPDWQQSLPVVADPTGADVENVRKLAEGFRSGAVTVINLVTTSAMLER